MRVPKKLKWAALVFLIATFGFILTTHVGESAVLTGYDQLALPGEAITVQAKLERDKGLVSPDIKGETLAFYNVGGGAEKSLGTGVTDSDGRASVSFTVPDKAGMVTIEARLTEKSKFTAAPAPILIAVVTKDMPLVVTDIDHTIADVSEIGFVTKESKDVPALPGSVEALTELSKKYTVVYLTARDDQFTGKTKEWLRLRKFPDGPALFRKLTLLNLSAESFKTKALKELKDRGFKLEWGFGEREDDMEAYGKNGIKGIQIVPSAKDSKLDGAAPFRVKDWSEVQKIVR